jgi:hypothetical protein
MPAAAGLCRTQDLIDRLWGNQTNFHRRLSRRHKVCFQNRHVLSPYPFQYLEVSMLVKRRVNFSQKNITYYTLEKRRKRRTEAGRQKQRNERMKMG